MPSEERDAEMLGVPVWRETTSIDVDHEVSEFTEWMVDGAEPGRWHAEPVAVAMVEVVEAAKVVRKLVNELDDVRADEASDVEGFMARVEQAQDRLEAALDNLDAVFGGSDAIRGA